MKKSTATAVPSRQHKATIVTNTKDRQQNQKENQSNDGQTDPFSSLDNFKIESRIGKGQFSVVYYAKSLTDKTKYAVKKVDVSDLASSKARQECMKEIELLKTVDHPNIIKYYASFMKTDFLYIICELADAGDLAKMITTFRNRKLYIQEHTVWKYFVQIASAIEHMHDRRIMHRDIKPANIFMTTSGAVKVGDLGLGRSFSFKTTVAHTLVGTPYYMSPERVKENGYNFKSDIWSLGCLLYEMAALRPPFYAENINLLVLCQHIEKCEYPPLRKDRYSSDLRDLVDACIQKEPNNRYDAKMVLQVAKIMSSKDKTKLRS
ncbi:uncharacterized protein TRIADDRAFT_27942 [Trichoplax adhaerens]|uniref:non-specific serine/threonine protein kinase n=1 Tax=Trichoplax adhaerens TaxID=10228 RepID=B3S192_TRIAD|nr:hypothetical protein TRIADDRAFT_27942 [Trichoplax adhaerens]EDV23200.1 hypothetical protein TRIADDRAFT_27942 [Trichoplax adhaerens]|eukprot:XP_002114110.1 hypothetical protein TRIADDRAFT_27942 [Trichoplax adhaerens]